MFKTGKKGCVYMARTAMGIIVLEYLPLEGCERNAVLVLLEIMLQIDGGGKVAAWF